MVLAFLLLHFFYLLAIFLFSHGQVMAMRKKEAKEENLNKAS